MSKYVGIDLGTTLSGIAHLTTIGKPEIIPNNQSERITPSLVYFPEAEPGKTYVGTEAKNSIELEPSRVVSEIKRRMDDAAYRIELDGRAWSPMEISALILRKLVEDASVQVGKITNAVISVPAYFDEDGRRATMEAGELAGLKVDAIINEPTAAALFYATTHEVNGTILVYDLGGGTFDVTLMEVQGQDVRIICSGGDHRLGGVDFDRALAKLISQKYAESKKSPLFDGSEVPPELMNDAEEIKKSLSSRETARKVVSGPAGTAKLEFTRSEFESAISTAIAKSEMLVESLLDEADISPSRIDKVLLVGGSCRIPYVQARLEKLFGFAPSLEVNVDECVALGAAVFSGLKAVRTDRSSVPAGVSSGLGDARLQDVCNHSYGTISLGIDEERRRVADENSIILKKNTPLPCTETQTYFTVRENQNFIDVSVTQGEGTDPEYVKIVHQTEMELPPNQQADRPIEITYSYDENQRMHCTFKDVESGRSLELDLTSRDDGGFDVAEKAASRAAVAAFQIE